MVWIVSDRICSTIVSICNLWFAKCFCEKICQHSSGDREIRWIETLLCCLGIVKVYQRITDQLASRLHHYRTTISQCQLFVCMNRSLWLHTHHHCPKSQVLSRFISDAEIGILFIWIDCQDSWQHLECLATQHSLWLPQRKSLDVGKNSFWCCQRIVMRVKCCVNSIAKDLGYVRKAELHSHLSWIVYQRGLNYNQLVWVHTNLRTVVSRKVSNFQTSRYATNSSSHFSPSRIVFIQLVIFSLDHSRSLWILRPIYEVRFSLLERC